jgi:ABC-type branched-subunit amino acid transport system permease subunit
MDAPAPAPAPPVDPAAKRRERRQGLAVAGFGLAVAIAALVAAVRLNLAHGGQPQPPHLTFLFLGAMVVYGLGIHRAAFAPRADPGGVPRHVRPWVSAAIALITWAVIAQIVGLVASLLRGP